MGYPSRVDCRLLKCTVRNAILQRTVRVAPGRNRKTRGNAVSFSWYDEIIDIDVALSRRRRPETQRDFSDNP